MTVKYEYEEDIAPKIHIYYIETYPYTVPDSIKTSYKVKHTNNEKYFW